MAENTDGTDGLAWTDKAGARALFIHLSSFFPTANVTLTTVMNSFHPVATVTSYQTYITKSALKRRVNKATVGTALRHMGNRFCSISWDK